MFEGIYVFKNFLKELDKDEIRFSPHFYEKRKVDRIYLTEKLILDSLKDVDNIQGFQKQKINQEERYRIGIKLSNKFNLVVISKLLGKSLYIITAWKSNRKWEKTIQK
jgi:hypothetical protein